MAEEELGDSEAKAILKQWPARTKKLWTVPGRHGFWMRGQPKDGIAVGPRLAAPGTKFFKTQPDGLWVYFQGEEFCDVVVVEVCINAQNLNDKRSRYIPASHSLILNCNKGWLKEEIKVQNGGLKARWEAAVSLSTSEIIKDIKVPVRHLRVVYALRQNHYDTWCSEHIPAGHEFFCSYTSLNSYNSPQMQSFLKKMSPFAQFYTLPKT